MDPQVLVDAFRDAKLIGKDESLRLVERASRWAASESAEGRRGVSPAHPVGDERAAEVVQRIYFEYLSGKGDRAIAHGLNRDGIPCPSARRPEQNRHRLADEWQGSAVRVVLENPRYTGYAVFGRWTKHEVLLNPDDVAAGHVTRYRRSEPDRIVRSRRPAHPLIISVEDFTQAQLLRRAKSAGGLRTARKAERSESVDSIFDCGVQVGLQVNATIKLVAKRQL